MASSTARAPSISCRSLCRQSSTIRTGCANKRPSGSARGAISDDRPYRDLINRVLGANAAFSTRKVLCRLHCRLSATKKKGPLSAALYIVLCYALRDVRQVDFLERPYTISLRSLPSDCLVCWITFDLFAKRGQVRHGHAQALSC